MLRLMIFVALVCVGNFVHAQKMPREDVIEVPAIQDGLCVSNLFQTNMVLQRDKPITIWGWAEAGESIVVEFAGKKSTTTASADRSWKASLPSCSANAKPQSLTVTGKQNKIELKNILVGDVWVLGGQSNMEFPLSRIENGQLEIVSANYPEIRILTVPAQNGATPKPGFPRLHEWSGWFGRHFRKGDWDVCSPEIVRELSAIGFVFARRIHKASNVPIGVIDVSRGGTTVETWTPDSGLRSIDSPQLQASLSEWDQKVADWDSKQDLAKRKEQYLQRIARLKKDKKPVPANLKEPTDLRPGPAMDQNRPGNCFASMMTPLAGLQVKGALFHQGYNNCFNGTLGATIYRQVFPKMIAEWRKAFSDPKLPFCILSLCTEGEIQTLDNYSEKMFNAGPYIREAQYQTFLDLYKSGDRNIGFVSTYDLRRRWYHPQLKIPAGERAARWALANFYGFGQELSWKPPIVQKVESSDGKIVIRFDAPVDAVDDGSPIVGFAVAGTDRKFHPATAEHLEIGKDDRGRPRKDKNALVLSSSMVADPIHYRYAWARSPLGNLQLSRQTDVPLATQRSDDWPLEAVPAGLFEGDPPEQLDRGQRRQVQQALKRIDLERRIFEARQLLNSQDSQAILKK